MTLTEIERLLDSGRLQARNDSMSNARWYDIRRNGATKRWKREPWRIEIPCKVGFCECFTLATRLDGPEPRIVRWSLNLRERPADFDPRKRD